MEFQLTRSSCGETRHVHQAQEHEGVLHRPSKQQRLHPLTLNICVDENIYITVNLTFAALMYPNKDW